jgi:hypothetical protein
MGFNSPISVSVVLVLVAVNYYWWIGPAIRAVVKRRFRWTIGGWLDVVFWLAFSLAILKNMPAV